MSAGRSRDPYATLGIGRGVSDAELRATYRRLVRLHHPDHNGGSRESTLRFQEIQEAYARVVAERRTGVGAGGAGASGAGANRARASETHGAPRQPAADNDIDARLRAMEEDLRAAKAAQAEAARAREAAARAAREAAFRATDDARVRSARDARDRASDEELGYVTTDDSFSKILSDALDGLATRFDKAASPVVKRIEDLIDEL